LAHPMDDGTAVMLERSIDTTARNLGPDGDAWRRMMEPYVEAWPTLRRDVLTIPRIPAHPFRMARFGLQGIQSAGRLARHHFRDERARALFAGLAGHSILPIEAAPSAAIGLVMGIAGHAAGWPIARGGSQRIADALAGYLRDLGGEIRTASTVTTIP